MLRFTRPSSNQDGDDLAPKDKHRLCVDVLGTASGLCYPQQMLKIITLALPARYGGVSESREKIGDFGEVRNTCPGSQAKLYAH